ncbi:MAG: hypothetical protein ACI9FW_001163 [Flavobacterium sp.]|jgi:hypothetical protein
MIWDWSTFGKGESLLDFTIILLYLFWSVHNHFFYLLQNVIFHYE